MGSSQIAVYSNEVAPHQHAEFSESVPAVVPAEKSDQNDAQAPFSLSTFDKKLSDIERRLASLEIDRLESTPPDSSESVRGPQDLPRSGDQLQNQLRRAGFSDSEVGVISATRDELRLRRLQLRDTAIREGWFRTDTWDSQVRELDSDSELRKTLGDQRFDDYLLATGRNNRVKIDELMTGSVAEQAGLLAGDLIHRYADVRVFNSSELRSLTTAGQAGASTALVVLRNGELVDLTVPRGPLGVMISGAAINNTDQ